MKHLIAHDLIRSSIEDPKIIYKHSKTGNLYDYFGRVCPTEFPDEVEADFSFIAQDSEDKSVLVRIYSIRGNLYYIPSESQKMSDNGRNKVLYAREGVFWLRTEEMFHENVIIDGKEVPRFAEISRG